MLNAVIVGLIVAVILIPCIAALPVITISADAVIASDFYTYIRAGCYFLPMGTVAAILGLTLALLLFRIMIAVIKAFWEILPFV